MPIHHNADDQQFTATADGHKAELAYSRPVPGIIDFTHTFVDKAIRGQGLAEEMAQAALAFAKKEHLKVKTSCTFMTQYVQRNHAKYADMLA